MSSLIPLTITTDDAALEINAYTIPPRTRTHAATGVTARGGSFTVGDRLELPSPLEVTADLPATTLPEATALAYAAIALAEEAIAVTTYEGTQAVLGLLGYTLETSEHDTARLTLRWAPASADRGAIPTPDSGAFTWDATAPDWSSTTPTWDATS